MVLDQVQLIWKWSQIVFEKKKKNPDFCRQTKLAKNKVFLMLFLNPSNKVGPNLKLHYERSLSQFHENGKQKLPSTTND